MHQISKFKASTTSHAFTVEFARVTIVRKIILMIFVALNFKRFSSDKQQLKLHLFNLLLKINIT